MDTLAPLSGKRILCIEDDDDTREMLRLLLASSGYEVVCAGTVADGLAIASAEGGFALYLLDNWLPDASGVEACKRIRRFEPTTPIVFCSAAAYDGDREKALEAGAHAYLVKPVAVETLVQTIGRLIRAERAANNGADRRGGLLEQD